MITSTCRKNQVIVWLFSNVRNNYEHTQKSVKNVCIHLLWFSIVLCLSISQQCASPYIFDFPDTLLYEGCLISYFEFRQKAGHDCNDGFNVLWFPYMYTDSKRKRSRRFIYFFLVKKDSIFFFFFKFNITELFCFLIRDMFAAFGVAAKLCDMFFGKKCKNQILAHKIFLNKPFQQISIYKSPA